jgi:hypothetical protein
MPTDHSYLARHGNVWRVQVAVPAKVQPILGAKVLFASTRTDSLSLANLRKHALIHTLKFPHRGSQATTQRAGAGGQPSAG